MEYTSCRWIEHGISFANDKVEMCCLRCHKGGGMIALTDSIDVNNFDWNKILETKKKYKENAKKGILPKECEGCFELNLKDWEDGEYIDTIHFDHWTKCNCCCMYCFTTWNKRKFNTFKNYRVMPVIEELFNKNLFKEGGEITFAGGEPALLDEFEEIVDLFLKYNVKLKVHSSGIKYCETIAKGISSGKMTVVLSADAGTKELYSKIKNVDAFDLFWENTKKYANCQPKDNKYLVSTKYILIPNVNINKFEIRKWLELNKKCGIKAIAADVEENFCADCRNDGIEYPKYLHNMAKYIVNKADDYGFRLLFYNNFWYIYYDTKAKRDLFVKQ